MAECSGLRAQSFPVGPGRQQALRPSEEEAPWGRRRPGPAEAAGPEEVSRAWPLQPPLGWEPHFYWKPVIASSEAFTSWCGGGRRVSRPGVALGPARGFLPLSKAWDQSLAREHSRGLPGTDPGGHRKGVGLGPSSAPGLEVATRPSWARTGRRLPPHCVAGQWPPFPPASPELHPRCGEDRPPGLR